MELSGIAGQFFIPSISAYHKKVTVQRSHDIKSAVRNGVLSCSAHHFERSSDHIAGDSRPFRKLTESPLTFCSNSAPLFARDLDIPCKFCCLSAHHYRLGLWPFDKMVRTEHPSGLHSGLLPLYDQLLIHREWFWLSDDIGWSLNFN